VPDGQYEKVFRGIRAVQRTQGVRDQLVQAIERGDLRPGEPLPSERAFAELLGVSRVAVREAIRSLEAVGVVEVRERRGSFVAGGTRAGLGRSWMDLYRNEVSDLLEVRGAVDQAVAERAARIRDPDALTALRAAHEQFADSAADSEQPIDQLVQLDIAFHEAIGQVSGNRLASHLLRDLNMYLAESRRIALSPRGRPRRSAREHGQILSAILAGDPAEAKAAAGRHVEAVLRAIEAAGSNAKGSTGMGRK
jgi:DNA-binding FadR family transcriptional regulator